MRYTIQTLGCKVNQYESQAMEQRLRELGHLEVGPGEDFDLAIVNTCTVTAVADKKNRNVIRRLRKQYGIRDFDGLADRCESWMNENAIRNFHMSAQFEDVSIDQHPYQNLTNITPDVYARYLLEIGMECLFTRKARLCGDMGYLHVGLADEKLLGIVYTVAIDEGGE